MPATYAAVPSGPVFAWILLDADTGQVLYAGGTDAGSCSPNHNESIQWQPIGARFAPTASLSLGPATFTAPAGALLSRRTSHPKTPEVPPHDPLPSGPRPLRA